eukprot:3759641-Rhodomonas_salina.2
MVAVDLRRNHQNCPFRCGDHRRVAHDFDEAPVTTFGSPRDRMHTPAVTVTPTDIATCTAMRSSLSVSVSRPRLAHSFAGSEAHRHTDERETQTRRHSVLSDSTGANLSVVEPEIRVGCHSDRGPCALDLHSSQP